MACEPQEYPRRQFLGWVLCSMPLPGALAACQQQGRPPGRSPEEMPDWMMSGTGTMDAEMMQEVPVIHDLLARHQDIRRTVDDFSYGIRASTTSARPEVAELIRAHAEQMKSRLERGAALRQLDPLFAEIFEHYQRIDLDIEHLPNGVRVSESSRDPVTVMLIRQHAHRAVSEFVAAGMNRAVRPTPLPPGYPG